MRRKIAINGFGRIGRQVFRILEQDSEVEVVAINDLTSPETLAHLLKYDSVHRTFGAEVGVANGAIVVNGRTIHTTAEKNAANLPWASLGVEVVLECTGVYKDKKEASVHLAAGARSVIISAPAKGVDRTVVVGVNDDQLDPAQHTVISNGSCTTNCLAPIAKVLDEAFGIERGFVTTVHSYTNDQRILDLPHSDLRRARAAALSMIPSSTGAAKAIGEVLPGLKGKLDGLAVRVPTPDVSLVDLVATVKTPTDAAAVNAALKAAANGPLAGILAFEEAPLVSSDFIGNPYSSIVDAENTMVIDGTLVKVLSWYDNEWGFSNRMVDLTRLLLGLPRGTLVWGAR